MSRARHVDEVVARVTATFAFYHREDGQWDDQPQLQHELNAAVKDVDTYSQGDKKVRSLFYRTLETELSVRYGPENGRQLVTLVRESSRNAGKVQPALL
jgi:hypothetical protein